MAKITRLSEVSAERRKPFGVRSALRECVCLLACALLVLAVPLAVVGFGIIYLTSRLVFSLTGKYPVNLSLHLGAPAE